MVQLQLGEGGADAAVNAVAEGQVAAGILAVKFQGVAIVEHALVAVRRNIPEDELVALFNLMPEQVGGGARFAAHVRERGLPAVDLAQRIGDQPRSGLELRALIGTFVEPIGEPRPGVERPVLSAEDHEAEVTRTNKRMKS